MPSHASTKVFLVEDFAPVRDRLTELLGEIDGVEIVGEADSPADAIGGILDKRPDWVVLDFQLLGGTGVEVLRAVHPKAPSVKFIVLTNHPSTQYRRACIESGAGWFFDKSTEFGKIKAVIAGPVAANS
ncbi:MAG TPA: response regulator transcription factor [Casimicrobiaceae bacterium]